MTNKKKIHDENNYFVLNLFYIYETHFVFPLWKILWKFFGNAQFTQSFGRISMHFHNTFTSEN